jgi:hypothetical protein
MMDITATPSKIHYGFYAWDLAYNKLKAIVFRLASGFAPAMHATCMASVTLSPTQSKSNCLFCFHGFWLPSFTPYGHACKPFLLDIYNINKNYKSAWPTTCPLLNSRQTGNQRSQVHSAFNFNFYLFPSTHWFWLLQVDKVTGKPCISK